MNQTMCTMGILRFLQCQRRKKKFWLEKLDDKHQSDCRVKHVASTDRAAGGAWASGRVKNWTSTKQNYRSDDNLLIQNTGVVPNVVLNERRNKEITMIIAFLHSKG